MHVGIGSADENAYTNIRVGGSLSVLEKCIWIFFNVVNVIPYGVTIIYWMFLYDAGNLQFSSYVMNHEPCKFSSTTDIRNRFEESNLCPSARLLCPRPELGRGSPGRVGRCNSNPHQSHGFPHLLRILVYALLVSCRAFDFELDCFTLNSYQLN